MFMPVVSVPVPHWNLQALRSRRKVPSYSRQVTDIDDTITIDVCTRIESRLPTSLPEGRLDDSQVVTIDPPITIQVTWYHNNCWNAQLINGKMSNSNHNQMINRINRLWPYYQFPLWW